MYPRSLGGNANDIDSFKSGIFYMKIQQPGKSTPINSNRQLDKKEFYQAIQKYGEQAKTDGTSTGNVATFLQKAGNAGILPESIALQTQLTGDSYAAGTAACSTFASACNVGYIYDSSKASILTTAGNYATNCCKVNYIAPTVDGTVCKLDTDITISSTTYHMISCKTVGTGSITFNSSVIADILVVASGGGGGYNSGGGGGAGGVVYQPNTTLLNNYSINLGAAGTQVTANAGTTAADTIMSGTGFTTITAKGGGGGGGGQSGMTAGLSGGSGGGSAYLGGGSTVALAGIQGNIGGNGSTAGSGGGGAGGSGSNASANLGANGGIGIDKSSIYGTGYGASGWFAGGGGGGGNSNNGGAGGTGGGGAGGHTTTAGIVGLANTGGGGGGGTNGGANGGSGVVLIRFK